MTFFVWTKMQTESGETLPTILALKEVERLAGKGVFWWGVGNSLGPKLRDEAERAGGTLPVLFSVMISRPQRKDTHPEVINVWTQFVNLEGERQDIPKHVLEYARADSDRDHHWALVCHSPAPLTIGSHGAFDPTRCKTVSGKQPADRQVTALLEGNLYEDHSPGVYHWGFRATLIKPWQVKLIAPRKRILMDKPVLDGWKDSWKKFVADTRAG